MDYLLHCSIISVASRTPPQNVECRPVEKSEDIGSILCNLGSFTSFISLGLSCSSHDLLQADYGGGTRSRQRKHKALSSVSRAISRREASVRATSQDGGGAQAWPPPESVVQAAGEPARTCGGPCRHAVSAHRSSKVSGTIVGHKTRGQEVAPPRASLTGADQVQTKHYVSGRHSSGPRS